MAECGKLYRIKHYDKNCLWVDIVTHSKSDGIVDEDDIFFVIEILPLNCLKILVGDGRIGWIYMHTDNLQKIN